MKAHLDAEATTFSVLAAYRPDPQVSIRVGPVHVTATVAEALELANAIADAIANMRAAYPNDSKENRI